MARKDHAGFPLLLSQLGLGPDLGLSLEEPDLALSAEALAAAGRNKVDTGTLEGGVDVLALPEFDDFVRREFQLHGSVRSLNSYITIRFGTKTTEIRCNEGKTTVKVSIT